MTPKRVKQLRERLQFKAFEARYKVHFFETRDELYSLGLAIAETSDIQFERAAAERPELIEQWASDYAAKNSRRSRKGHKNRRVKHIKIKDRK